MRRRRPTRNQIQQRQVRLSEESRRELVDRYRAGCFKKELAGKYGIHIETVRAINARQTARLPAVLTRTCRSGCPSHVMDFAHDGIALEEVGEEEAGWASSPQGDAQ